MTAANRTALRETKLPKRVGCNVILKQRKNIKYLAEDFFHKGEEAFEKEELKKAIENLQEAVNLFKQMNDNDGCVKALCLLGFSYAEILDTIMEMDTLLDAMYYTEQKRENPFRVSVYNNIGSRYQALGEDEKAILYFLKAQKENERASARLDSRHELRTLIISINLAFSYIHLKRYTEAKRHLDIAKEMGREKNTYKKYYFNIEYIDCKLHWEMGEKEFVYQRVKELEQMSRQLDTMFDYIENIKEFTELLLEIKEFPVLNKVIEEFEYFIQKREDSTSKILAIEMRMKYYKAIGDIEEYTKYCLQFAEIYQLQRKEDIQSRIHAMDMKIELNKREIERKKVERKNEKLKKKSENDALTGLANRYVLHNYAKKLILKSYQEKKKIAVGVIDLDYFKQFNDTYGHLKGDRCLVSVAKAIARAIGEDGKVFRYGGDEFVLLLKNGEAEWVKQKAENIKKEVEKLHITHKNSKVSKEVTLSQGYTCFIPEKICNLDCFISSADQALYKIKETSRNNFLIIE